MSTLKKKILGLFLALMMVSTAALSGCNNSSSTESEVSSASESSQTESADNSSTTSDDSTEDLSYQINDDGSISMSYGAILHAWCWSFNTITENLQDIADAGYTSVQTSPINECKVGEDGGMCLYSDNDGKWYYQYQPTDYVIGNYQLGTLEEFETMCAAADELGIKIIVDVVLNHVSSDISVVSENITGLCDEPFHNNGEIGSYSSRKQVTQYDLLGLLDLNTQATEVQQYELAYLKSCIAAGASGFRFDATKHIELSDDDEEYASDFWTVILDNGAEFQYGEVLQDETSRIDAYAEIMSVTASTYGSKILESASSGNMNLASIETYAASGADESRLVTWVESHDNYCNDGSWEQAEESDIEYGWAIIAARSGGAPLFFSRPMGSSLDSQWGNNVIGEVGSYAYKSENVSAVNHFRNEMAGLGETLSNPDGDGFVLMIERGDKGAVIINRSGSDYELDGTASVLASGTYYDKVTNAEFTVEDGTISGTVPAGAIIVIY